MSTIQQRFPADHKRWPLLMHDQARLEYGRIMWRHPHLRVRLFRHWTDPRHPYLHHSQEKCREVVEMVLSRPLCDDDALDAELRGRDLSLRVVVRKIPLVFGSFY